MKLSLFANYLFMYTENPKDSTQKPLQLTNKLNKVAEYKINIEKSLVFLYANNNTSETGSNTRET